MAAIALTLAAPAAWAAATHLPAATAVVASLQPLLAHMAMRGRALLTAFLAAEPSSYALGMTGTVTRRLPPHSTVTSTVNSTVTSTPVMQVPWP